MSRNLVFVFTAFLACLWASPIHASPTSELKTRVSVIKFTNKSSNSGIVSSNCNYLDTWWEHLENAFSDILIERLSENSKIEVLERETIRRIYDNEVALENSDDDSVAKRKFLKAKITFVGAVDGFELCQSKSAVAMDVGQLFGVSGIVPSVATGKASVSIIIRAVDTATGRVLATARAKKEQTMRGVALHVDAGPVNFRGDDFKQTAMGEVIRDAIFEASDGILTKLKI